MIKVAVCICTRRRPEGVSALLRSIESLRVPGNVALKVIVVENDQEAKTKPLIDKIATSSKFDIVYFLEQNQGISYARNRTVRECGDVDFCCFVDDDQVVSKEWLEELLICQEQYNADGVWGPNPPLFASDVPDYIIQFHKPQTFDYGESVEKAYTNCLLLRKIWLNKIDGPFDLRLNFTGGEDRFLTTNIVKSGGTIKYNPRAVAYEVVPPERSNLKYVVKRTIKMANTRYYVDSLLNRNFSKLGQIPRLALRLVYGLLLLIPSLLTANKLTGLIKLCDSIGGFMYIFGRKNKFYR